MAGKFVSWLLPVFCATVIQNSFAEPSGGSESEGESDATEDAEAPAPEDGPDVPITSTPATAAPEATVDDKTTLPSPEYIPAAPYPPKALEDGLESQVLLQLSIDDTGRVTDASVAESGGESFDQAALNVAPSFVFSPATDAKGRPQAAQILYRYVFKLAAVPVVNVEGTVLAAGVRQPVPNVQIQVQQEGFPALQTQTDELGRFRLADVPTGTWTISATREGFQAEITEFDVTDGAVTQVTLYPVQDRPWLDNNVDDTIEVVSTRVAPEITERILNADDIRYLPGTNGDVVRAIQNLPGIARPPLNIGQLIIRGTSPEDSRYYLDGMKIPIVFHFSGLSTVINGDSIEEVAFLPGNYGVRYGRSLGRCRRYTRKVGITGA